MERPVRVAVMGLGQRGLQHLKSLWRLREEGAVEIVGLADAFVENLAPEKIGKYVPGYSADGLVADAFVDTVIREAAPDALYVAIPPGVHAGEVVAAARAGVHLMVEKPMSLYLDEAASMARAIDDSDVVATVGFQQRYSPRNEAVRDFLADRRVVLVNVVNNGALENHSTKHTPTDRLDGPKNRVWTASMDWSGASVVEAGIHQVDLMRYWCGDIAWVEATYMHRDASDIEDGGDNPYAYRVAYGFESGAIGSLIMSRLRRSYYNDGYQGITWTHGQVKFEGHDAVAYHYDGPYPPEQRPSAEELRHVLPTAQGEDPTTALARAFVGAVAARSEDGLRSTFSGSMNSLAAVLGANISDRLGGERVSLADLPTAARYAEFRRRPGPAAA
ncbi:Gfo/Idh/MocA family oxidoreductase [Candidatus Poribacteria bacterium]|jgi:predicted dehydrogenase|nr:Gfo/Idh/MocA family oxidoreductase [Candidatus Poribacteria bacterium]MBT5533779.1 Gfo/Idh/MocA family oxidoreductase [Candidatus Poribacteria bacterium]MBT5712305.1 Gfo/Idh/MocA family oxidoreductase [Candidatus Poribacteria bacterium]MBT7099686.1 Gfo/Idh/MocA family oxidoreductase [Candidatus Poribacteria bacterium]MBT7805794.1 Gfo/Idh/MocA family oxidoreductase [Candidatus Poribacteria bacterium]